MTQATLERTEREKALSAPAKVAAQSQAVKPKASYTTNGSGVKKGFEWLFIYPVEDGLEAKKLYDRMRKNVKTSILVMVYKSDSAALAIDLASGHWKQYPGRPSEREMTWLQRGALHAHPRHDPEGFARVMREHGVRV